VEEKELKKLTEAIDSKIEEFEKLIDTKAGAEKMIEIQKELSEKIDALSTVDEKPIAEYVKEVQDHANTLEEQIKEIVQKGQAKVKHPEEAIAEFMESDDWKESVKSFKDGGRPKVKVLTVGSDLTAGTTSPVILPSREPGVEAAPRADTPIYNLVQKGTTSSNKVSWIERTLASESPGAAAKAENNEFGESDALWTEVEANIIKLTDMLKATNEMIEDTEFVRSEIMSMLSTNIPHLRETELLAGTNSSTSFNGLVTAATAFAKPSGVDAVAAPNNIDVLRVAVTQCMIGYNGSNAYTKGYTPNAIVLNPVDAHNIGSIKDANENYVLPMYLSANGKVIDGIPVIVSTDMTAGTFLVGDLSVAKYYVKRGLQVKFWDQYETDPAFDRVLFTATERGCQKISNIGAYGLIYGTFAAGITAIT